MSCSGSTVGRRTGHPLLVDLASMHLARRPPGSRARHRRKKPDVELDATQVDRGSVAGVPLRPLEVDVVTFLTLWLLLVFFIPSSQTVPGFGAIGQPGLLLSLVAPVWWLASRLVPSMHSAQGPQPIRIALLLYAAYALASFGMAAARPLTTLEMTASTREIMRLFTLVGVALLVADGIHSGERLRVLLTRIVYFTGVLAAIGIAQFFTGETLTPTIPFLEGKPPEIGFRGGLARALGTARHYIEFAVIVGAMLPLAIHFFLYGRKLQARVAAAIVVALLLLAIPVSLSRTAVVSSVTALLVLGLGWSWRRRINGVLLFLVVLPVVSSTLPGVLDVMIRLFTEADQDSSVQARLSRQSAVTALIRERPWFGLGYGTWTSDGNFLLDNELWRTTLETGYVGIFLVTLLALVACFLAVPAKTSLSATEVDRHLGFAVAGSIAGLFISVITVDAFSYRILTSLLFVLIGTSGALWRFNRGDDYSNHFGRSDDSVVGGA